MKYLPSYLLLPTLIAAAKESHDASGSMTQGFLSETSCLNTVYQTALSDSSTTTTLQCLSTKRFWTKISAEASSQCAEGRSVLVQSLSFEADFSVLGEAHDFGVYVSTSATTTTGGAENPFLMPLYGESCAVQSLTEGSCGAMVEGIVDLDGDGCLDVDASNGGPVVATFSFAQPLLVPCSSYGVGSTAHLQFCSVWSASTGGGGCDVDGIVPGGTEECACEMVDLGVEIVKPEDMKPTCEPTPSVQTPNLRPPTHAAMVPTQPTSSDDAAGSDDDATEIDLISPAPTPAPFVIVIEKPEPHGSDEDSDDGVTDESTWVPTGTDGSSIPVTEAYTCSSMSVIKDVTSTFEGAVTLESTSSPSKGACSVLSSSQIIYYPLPSTIGTDSCAYTVCGADETSGEKICTEGLLKVEVLDCPAPTTPAPAPAPGPASLSGGTAMPTCDYETISANNNMVSIPINTPVDIGVLENDTPAPSSTTLTVTSILFSGNNGACTIVSGGSAIHYVPHQDFFGTDKCIYTACDQKGHCDSAVAEIEVTPPSEGVIANDDNVQTEINTPIDVFALENDQGVEGYPLSVVSIQTPAANGDCVVVDSNAVVMYIPNPNYGGEDRCEYLACDSRGMCDEAVITITVVGAPCDETEVPVVPAPTASVVEVPVVPVPTPTTAAPTDKPALNFAWNPTTPSPTPAPTGEPITPEPTPLPTQKPALSWDFIAPEPTNEPTDSPVTPAPVTPEPTPVPSKKPVMEWGTLPTTPAPTPCDMTFYFYNGVCSNSGSVMSGSSGPYADATMCCDMNFGTGSMYISVEAGGCIYNDECNTPAPVPVPAVVAPTTAAPTPCDSQVFFFDGSKCTNEYIVDGAMSYDTAVSCCELAFGAGSYMNGSCDYFDMCSTPVPTPVPVEPFVPVAPPTTPAPTPCDAKLFFFDGTACTNEVVIDNAMAYDSAMSCCELAFGAGSYANGSCKYVDTCNCVPTPLSPIELTGKTPTPEPTPLPTPVPTLEPITPSPTLNPVEPPTTPAPTVCEERLFFFTSGICTNELYIADAMAYASVSDCCDSNVALGSAMNGRCQYVDMCSTPPPTPSFVTDTLSPTISTPPPFANIVPPPTPLPTEPPIELNSKTYAPSPFPTFVEVPTTPAPSFGSTPTVGTDKTLSPVRERDP